MTDNVTQICQKCAPGKKSGGYGAPCAVCPPGTPPNKLSGATSCSPCKSGSVASAEQCISCVQRSSWADLNTSSCKTCSVCTDGQKAVSACTLTADTICQCASGYYDSTAIGQVTCFATNFIKQPVHIGTTDASGLLDASSIRQGAAMREQEWQARRVCEENKRGEQVPMGSTALSVSSGDTVESAEAEASRKQASQRRNEIAQERRQMREASVDSEDGRARGGCGAPQPARGGG